jgi:malonate-semialdehyde dehydrogenase (acetylating)/methylmalonate-semialdehyde dehydrogenase
MTMQLITRYIEQSGLPHGVFNLVNGDYRVGEALIAHPHVRGVSVVGSTPTCRAIAQACAAQGKRCQAMGGAKNHLVAMPDAKVDDMLRNMVTSCYGCAGQRCMASSAIVAVGDAMHSQVCRRFVEASKNVIVSDPLDPAVADEAMVMGPVISAKAKSFIEQMIDTGVREGATLALDGRGCTVEGKPRGHFVGPTVLTEVQPGSTVHRTEIFGPVVVVLKAATLDEAIRIINDGPYGNGASIYTQNGFWARKFKLEVDSGMVGVNVGIPAPVASLPFGGMKASLLCDIKTQGRSGIDFFTTRKIVTERYWAEQ